MFKSVTSQAVMAVVALGLGATAWTAAAREERVADAMRSLVTFRADEAAARLESIAPPSRVATWLPGVSTSAAGVGRARAAASYWNGTGTVAATDDALVAANAAYREIVREGGDASAMVTKLDGVVKQYADVVRADPASADAAYNYEFAVRYRAAIAARRQPVPPAAPDEGLTMHGRAGAPPKGTDSRSFKMIVPMRPDERQQAEEAGRSGKRTRKG